MFRGLSGLCVFSRIELPPPDDSLAHETVSRGLGREVTPAANPPSPRRLHITGEPLAPLGGRKRQSEAA